LTPSAPTGVSSPPNPAAPRGPILDGVDRLKPGCLPFLQRLLVDGEVALYDGALFKNEPGATATAHQSHTL